MTRWYRRYSGTVSDPKIAEAALIAECSKAIVIATWDMILENAAETNNAGSFHATPRNVAATLNEQPATIERVFAALETLKMVQSYVVTSWSKRQFQSDSSTERSKKHRALKRANGGATPAQRCATPPDTESDTDTERKDTPLPPLQGADPVELYEAIAAQKRPRQRGQRLSSDWQIPDGWRQWARVNCFAENAEITRQAEIFRDYWTAKPGAQAAKLDWEATWRNWCRRAFSPAGRHQGIAKPATTGTFTPKRQTFVDYDEENRRVAEMARKLVDAAVAGVTP